MAALEPEVLEVRTRITLLLSAPTTLPQHFLVNDIVTGLIAACGGVTVSSVLPAVFTGSWIDEHGLQHDDDNLLILADAQVSLGEPSLIAALRRRLKRRCEENFDQKLVWVTAHEIHRITRNDNEPPVLEHKERS